MPTYLVEAYLPQAASGAAATVASLIGTGADARLRWSIVLPAEDLCLHVLEGPSVEAVREAVARAALRCQRISQVLLLSAERDEPERGAR